MVEGKITKEYTFWCGNQECSCCAKFLDTTKKKLFKKREILAGN